MSFLFPRPRTLAKKNENKDDDDKIKAEEESDSSAIKFGERRNAGDSREDGENDKVLTNNLTLYYFAKVVRFLGKNCQDEERQRQFPG